MLYLFSINFSRKPQTANKKCLKFNNILPRKWIIIQNKKTQSNFFFSISDSRVYSRAIDGVQCSTHVSSRYNTIESGRSRWSRGRPFGVFWTVLTATTAVESTRTRMKKIINLIFILPSIIVHVRARDYRTTRSLRAGRD